MAGTLTPDPVLAHKFLQLGCGFVAMGPDVSLLANAARKLAAEFIAQAAA